MTVWLVSITTTCHCRIGVSVVKVVIRVRLLRWTHYSECCSVFSGFGAWVPDHVDEPPSIPGEYHKLANASVSMLTTKQSGELALVFVVVSLELFVLGCMRL